MVRQLSVADAIHQRLVTLAHEHACTVADLVGRLATLVPTREEAEYRDPALRSARPPLVAAPRR